MLTIERCYPVHRATRCTPHTRTHRDPRGKTMRFQRENAVIPYCAPESGLYLAPRRTAFLSQSENLFTIPGEEHGREEDGSEEGWREEGRRQEVLGEEGRGKEGWRQEGGEVRREEGWGEERRREEGGEAHTERRVHEGDDTERPARCRRGNNSASPYRSHQEALAVHQAEGPAGCQEPPADQRRREPEADLRRQVQRLDVRDDEARQQAPEVVRRLRSATRGRADRRHAPSTVEACAPSSAQRRVHAEARRNIEARGARHRALPRFRLR